MFYTKIKRVTILLHETLATNFTLLALPEFSVFKIIVKPQKFLHPVNKTWHRFVVCSVLSSHSACGLLRLGYQLYTSSVTYSTQRTYDIQWTKHLKKKKWRQLTMRLLVVVFRRTCMRVQHVSPHSRRYHTAPLGQLEHALAFLDGKKHFY